MVVLSGIARLFRDDQAARHDPVLAFAGCVGVSLLSRRLFTACLRFAPILLVICGASGLCASAQKTATPQESGGTIIPAPPVVHVSFPTETTHQAKQDPSDPTRATDSTTGQNLYWNPDKKTWVDSKTGQSVGFDGVQTSDGTIIPAPPVVHVSFPTETTHQAKQDPSDPTRATDSTTGQNFYWDPGKKTWVDSKTGQSVGFDGVQVPASPPPPSPAAKPSAPETAPPEKNKTVSVSTPSQPAPPKPLLSMEVGGGVGFNNIGGTSGDRAAFLNSFPGGTFSTSANTFAGNVGSSLGIGPAVFDFTAWRANGSDSRGSGSVLGGGTDTALITQQFQGLSVIGGFKIPLGGKVSFILGGGGNFWHANIDTEESVTNGTTGIPGINHLHRGVDGFGWAARAEFDFFLSQRLTTTFRCDEDPLSNAGVNVHLFQCSLGLRFKVRF